MQRSICVMLVLIGLAAANLAAAQDSKGKPSVEVRSDEAAGATAVWIDGKQAVALRHGKDLPFPRFSPVNSPSGKLLTDEHPPKSKFPHHQSLWIADKVQFEGGPVVDFYHEFHNRVSKNPADGYKHFIRNETVAAAATGDRATMNTTARWFVNSTTPVLNEARQITVIALGDGEYLIDMAWSLTAGYGDVKVVSDWIHYAWPYVRIHPQFAGPRGGVITNSEGGVGEKETHGKVATWIDFSNTVDGAAEGLAVFVHPDGKTRKWLTREYGTFGPRRPDELSGTHFTLKKGDTLTGRVGILVHKGDVATGRVAERFKQYSEGKL